MTDLEIIQLLGGVSVVARLLNIQPPSVHGWLKSGIPEHRLRELAPTIEARSNGRFTRRARWPDNFAFYWPELATMPAAASTPTHAAPDTCLCASALPGAQPSAAPVAPAVSTV